jgi:probable rRNA maturation factor
MQIDITDLQTIVRIDKRKMKKCAEVALKALGEKKAELSLLFVDDFYIKRLNRDYRGLNSETDVLAFSMRDGEKHFKDHPILGDVVISTESAKREAKKRKIPIQNEICLYLAHGILHLLGHEDNKASDRKKMKTKEIGLLEAMCGNRIW